MFVEAEIWNVARTDQGYAVLIKPIGTMTAVPIYVGQLEAQSILIGMGDIPMPRPNTHDLLLSGLAITGNTVEKVEMTEIKDGIYYASIFIHNITGTQTLDARPSDSIALAVRVNCPIYIAESIVDEAGVSLTVLSEKTGEINSEYDKKKNILEKELEEAVKLENYEEAAGIRDMLQSLEEDFS